MEVWQPSVKNGSAVLIFKDLRDWDKVEAALGKKAESEWEPLTAQIAKGKPKHFVYMGGLLVCNNDAWQLLKDELKDEVEALPIHVGASLYYIVNVVNVVDCLDFGASRFLRTPFDSGVGEILQYAFQQSRLEGHLLFALPQNPKTIFATSAFKSLVEKFQLNDIVFQKPASPLEGLSALLSSGPD